jgi:asparagine synthase (glutamine-hydrolysing)
MCGIAGYFSISKQFNDDDLHRMTDAIKHRGPDASGFYHDDVCSLGHRRLSIIDLSERANQPMRSKDGRYIIAYNGEVYNYNEIASRLKEKIGDHNFIFRTASDTEVILEGLAQYGIDFVHQLNGMFAIAFYDTKLQELYLIRDRLGIKPIFYYWDGNNLAFASEIKAVLKIDKLDKEINKNSVADFLHLGFIAAPNTIYKKIYKLNAGSYLKINSQGISQIKYYNIRQRFSSNIITDKEEALVKLSDLLMSSVQYQMKSDVPFGVFLSGGIDSSLITAQAVNLSGSNVNTFSIGFEENSHNESEFAKAVANHLGTKHHEFIVSYKDAINLFDRIFDSYDEPNADSSLIPTMLVSQLARKYVTVTLSGEGGDELFFGYGSYKWAKRLSSPLFNLVRKPLSEVLSHMPSRYERISRLMCTENSSNLRSHIFSQEQYYFTSKEIKQITKPEFSIENSSFSILNQDWDSLLSEKYTANKYEVIERKLTPMEQQALYDLQFYLPDDLLTKVDRASMQFSLETRVPYLDHRVVEFAINLAPNLKYHDGIQKYILKQILYKYVPEKLFNRPKQGFAIPLSKWLKNELRYLIDEYLSDEAIKDVGVFELETTKKLVSDYFGGKDFLHNRVWLMIILQKWFKDYR